MGRPRKPRKPGTKARYTLIVPGDLDTKITALAGAEGRDISNWLRDVLEMVCEQKAGGQEIRFATVSGIKDPRMLCVAINPLQRKALEEIGERAGMDAESAAAMLLGKHLGDELLASRQRDRELGRLFAEGDGPSLMNGTDPTPGPELPGAGGRKTPRNENRKN